MLLHRRQDLAEEWPDDLGSELVDLQRTVEVALRGLVGRRAARPRREDGDGAPLPRLSPAGGARGRAAPLGSWEMPRPSWAVRYRDRLGAGIHPVSVVLRAGRRQCQTVRIGLLGPRQAQPNSGSCCHGCGATARGRAGGTSTAIALASRYPIARSARGYCCSNAVNAGPWPGSTRW